MTHGDLPSLVHLKNMQKIYDSHRRKIDELLDQQKSIKTPLKKYNPLSKLDKDEVEQLSLLVKEFKTNETSLKEQYQTSKKTVKKLVAQIDESYKYLDEAAEEYLKKKAELKDLMKSSKIFEKAIKKYSTKFNFLVAIERYLDDDIFVASVKLLDENNSATDNIMHLVVNRTTRSVIDFDLPLWKEEELQSLKQEVLCDEALNLKLLLKRFIYVS